MESQLVLVVLAATVLLGGALFATLRAERRRESRQQRLQAVLATSPAESEPGLSLRRALPKTRLHNLLLLAALRRRFDAALAAAGNRIGLPHLLLTGLLAGAVVLLFASRVLTLDPALAFLLAGAAALAAPTQLLRFAQSRYQNRFLEIFPDALDLVARAVKAGLPVFDAMEVAAREIRPPVGTEFQRTLDEMRIGVEIEEAMLHTADRIRVPDFRFYVVALALQRRTGGSLAETLAGLSNIIRRRKEVRLKARALTSESKASAAVLGVLPFLVGAVLFFLNSDLMSVMFVDRRGRFMLGLAIVSILAGIVVMAAIIKRALR